MKKNTVIALVLCLIASSTILSAKGYHTHRPDAHAPIGVMGDHIHNKGEWMFSYRYGTMEMDGLKKGTDGISQTEFFDTTTYKVAPTDMTMDMHMYGVMGAPSDKITLMAMIPYVKKSMTHFRNMDQRSFTTTTEGWGDLKLSALYSLIKRANHRLHAHLGISAPTGKTTETVGIPGMGVVRAPYPMQLGSGTWDILPGLTYTSQYHSFSWGSQWTAAIPTGENNAGYTKGNEHTLTTWIAKPFSKTFSTSLRLTAKKWDDISGSDSTLNPALVPTAETNNGGSRVDLSIGANLLGTGELKSGRLAIEAGLPIAQDLDNIQLETDWWFTAGIQWTIK